MASADVKRYWSRVVALGCVICGGPAEIAHCHGGSIVERLQEPKCKGVKLPRLDWICLPLCPAHHRIGNTALDNGVRSWEAFYGKQADHIDRIAAKLKVDVWARAKEGAK